MGVPFGKPNGVPGVPFERPKGVPFERPKGVPLERHSNTDFLCFFIVFLMFSWVY